MESDQLSFRGRESPHSGQLGEQPDLSSSVTISNPNFSELIDISNEGSIDSNRRQSMELEQQKPRKRIAISLENSTDERDRSSSTSAENLSDSKETNTTPEILKDSTISDEVIDLTGPIVALQDQSDSSDSQMDSSIEIRPSKSDPSDEEISDSENAVHTSQDSGSFDISTALALRQTLLSDNPKPAIEYLINLIQYVLEDSETDSSDTTASDRASLLMKVPQLSIDLWFRTNGIETRFWREDGEELCYLFYKSFVKITIFFLKQEQAVITSNTSFASENFHSLLFVKALNQIHNNFSCSIAFLSTTVNGTDTSILQAIPSMFYREGGILRIMELWSKILSSDLRLDSDYLLAAVPYLELLGSNIWFIVDNWDATDLSYSFDNPGDSKSSESSDEEVLSAGQNAISLYSRYLFFLEDTISNLVDSNSGPEAELLLILVEKSGPIFAAIAKSPMPDILSEHAAFQPVLPAVDNDLINDIYNNGFKIRTFYWSIRIFEGRKRDYKLKGLKAILHDLQVLYQDRGRTPDRSQKVLAQAYSTLFYSMNVTEQLIHSDANIVLLSQFGIPIFSFLSHFQGLDLRDLNILWSEMISEKSVSLSKAKCSILQHIVPFMSEDHVSWLVKIIPSAPLAVIDHTFFELIESVIKTLQSGNSKNDLSQSNSTLASEILDVLLQLIKLLSSLTQEQEKTNLKIDRVEGISIIIKLVQLLMLSQSQDLVKSSYLIHHLDSLETFSTESLADLAYIKSFLSSASESSQLDAATKSALLHANTDRFEKSLVSNVEQFSDYPINQFVSLSLYRLNIQLRQDCLLQLLALRNTSISSLPKFEVMFNALCPAGDKNQEFADSFWQELSILSGNLQSRCKFVDNCFRQIRNLPEDNLSSSCANFVIKFAEYSNRIGDISQAWVDHGFDIIQYFYLNSPSEECLDQIAQSIIDLLLVSDPRSSCSDHDMVKLQCQIFRAVVKAMQETIAQMHDTSAKRRFERSIKFLNLFIQKLRTKSSDRISRIDPELHSFDSPSTIRIQWHGGLQSDIDQITLNKDCYVIDLFREIYSIVGDSLFRLIALGSELKLKDFDKTLTSIGFQDRSSIIVSKRGEVSEDKEMRVLLQQKNDRTIIPKNAGLDSTNDPSMAIENEFVNAFNTIHSFLALPDSLSVLVYDLLLKMDPSPNLVDSFLKLPQDDSTWDSFFPSQSPFEMLYSKHLLDIVSRHATVNNQASDLLEFLVPRMLNLIVLPTLFQESESEIRKNVQVQWMKVISDFLHHNNCNAKKLLTGNQNSFADLVQSLSSLCSNDCDQLCELVLDIMLLLSERDSKFWEYVEQSSMWRKVIGRCLLFTTNESLKSYYQQSILKFVQIDTEPAAASRTVLAVRATKYFWDVIEELLPLPNNPFGQKSSIVFDIAGHLFRSIFKSVETQSTYRYLKALLNKWLERLVTEKPIESIINQNSDRVICGYADLITALVQLKWQDPNRGSVVYDINWTYWTQKIILLLFPILTEDSELGTRTTELVGCLSSESRRKLLQLLKVLSMDEQVLQNICGQMFRLYPKDGHPLIDAWNKDRSRWLRSQVGYVGLNNLANTCYINSLLSQLFMNVDFRNRLFSLAHLVSDDLEKKNSEPLGLLSELLKLFYELRYSYLRVADPRNLVASIVDFENKPVDITVQMDVDEFYNLLFDRLESQISDADLKHLLTNCFGGSLITQIKSKGCEHVSQRTEPFSAVQCDIKGKKNLRESLNAFVEGEIMDGDNKYWCSQCSTHVEAEKRTCLNEVPDNLIFHLKRFNFDLATMLRSKINDYFEFPLSLDIAPYKYDTLTADKTSCNPNEEDTFQLSGILVHSGTAESGHYYSYIRDRDRWAEFNDSEILPFDESHIGRCCFGGIQSDQFGNLMDIPFSAYMLFYERVSPKNQEYCKQSEEIESDSCLHNLRRYICQENEILSFKWTLFGDEHIEFVSDCFVDLSIIQGSTSDFSNVDGRVIDLKPHELLMFETLYQVAIRSKNTANAESMIKLIDSSITVRSSNGFRLLFWLVRRMQASRGILVRCPQLNIRRSFRLVIEHSLRATIADFSEKEELRWLREFENSTEVDDIELTGKSIPIIFIVFCFRLLGSRGSSNIGRGNWDEMMLLLSHFTCANERTRTFSLCMGALQIALEAIMEGLACSTGLIELTMGLIEKISKSDTELADNLEERREKVLRDVNHAEYLTLLRSELQILSRGHKKGVIIFLYRILEQGVTNEQVLEIVKMLRSREVTAKIFTIDNLFLTAFRGIHESSDSISAQPFMQFILCLSEEFELDEVAAAHACRQFVPTQGSVSREERDAEVDIVERKGEALAVFLADVSTGRGSRGMLNAVRQSLSAWATMLLVHWNAAVRTSVVQTINRMLFLMDVQGESGLESSVEEQLRTEEDKERQDIVVELIKGIRQIVVRWRTQGGRVIGVTEIATILTGCSRVTVDESILTLIYGLRNMLTNLIQQMDEEGVEDGESSYEEEDNLVEIDVLEGDQESDDIFG
ncbi:uncharacterized protein V1516DRAFT_665637 [Lipomyces oligophaga]|uniref:uncharacterized protein n=1 Tax=Lipomyces oligophaga TaxID=45792 RepID=UPI0034CF9578